MTRPLRITLTTPYGPRRGEVARLGVDELSLILDDQGPGPWRSGACAFALAPDGGETLWGTLDVAPPCGMRDRRVRARILSVNGAQRARLDELAAALAAAARRTEEPGRDDAASRTVPTIPTDHGFHEGDETSVQELAVATDGVLSDLHIESWSSSSKTGSAAEALAGRGAIRSALRRSLADARWDRRRDRGRTDRLRVALGRGEAALTEETPTDPGRKR
ncbi:MAG: hypothetical protein H6742_21875 [Alphaproteobacteria bacterium]|nr:hypothetical protein [Alphaproteobacteria bacterium]